MDKEESNTPQRPNAKYNLSKPDNAGPSDEGLTFYYSRERRLENAPKEVQDLYKEQKQSRPGLFGTLVADRPRKFLFFCIVILCIVIFAFTRLGFFEESFIIDGNRIEVTGTIFEGTTIVRLVKTAQNTGAFTGAVSIEVSETVHSAGGQYFVFNHRVIFSSERQEEYRFAVPFDSGELLIVLKTETHTLDMKFNPE